MSMKCREVRRLFAAYWDDETTLAEREWVEAHFAACGACRRGYEELSYVLEAVVSLPRHEASPDLLDRTLARTRRVQPAQDALPVRGAAWVPATAAAALLLVATAVVFQWAGIRPGQPVAGSRGATDRAAAQTVADRSPVRQSPASQTAVQRSLAVAQDSVFDHSEDIEFVLDPVTLKRGRATVTRDLPGGIRTDHAVVSF